MTPPCKQAGNLLKNSVAMRIPIAKALLAAGAEKAAAVADVTDLIYEKEVYSLWHNGCFFIVYLRTKER
jgi:hypothetical protein